ncbi:hypothetical protein D3C86_1952050 [compost metagenome]
MAEIDLVGEIEVRRRHAGDPQPVVSPIDIGIDQVRVGRRLEALGGDGKASHIQAQLVAAVSGQVKQPGQGVGNIGLGHRHGGGIPGDGGIILDGDIQLAGGGAMLIGYLDVQLE